MKEAGDRITSARKHFRTLCGGDRETSKKGGTIGKTLEDHSVGIDISKEEDADKLDKLVTQTHCQGMQEYERLMQSWDVGNNTTAKIGLDSEETDSTHLY